MLPKNDKKMCQKQKNSNFYLAENHENVMKGDKKNFRESLFTF